MKCPVCNNKMEEFHQSKYYCEYCGKILLDLHQECSKCNSGLETLFEDEYDQSKIYCSNCEEWLVKEFEFDSDYYFKRCMNCNHVDFGDIKRFYYPEWCLKYKKRIQEIQFCKLH